MKVFYTRPVVVGTLTGAGSVASQLTAAKKAGVDLIELRLDTFRTLPKDVLSAIRMAHELIAQITSQKFPVLFTLRSPTETGVTVSKKGRRTDDWRADVIENVLSRVDLVDLEISQTKFAERVSRKARRLHVDVILSAHDFKSVPSNLKLNQLRELAVRLRANFLKIAGRPSSDLELRRLMMWGRTVKEPKLILIGMGAPALDSRLLGFSFGSVFTYGHLGRRSAPGQISAGELSKAVRSIYG